MIIFTQLYNRRRQNESSNQDELTCSRQLSRRWKLDLLQTVFSTERQQASYIRIHVFISQISQVAMLLSKENEITFLHKDLFCPKLDSLFPTPLIPMQLDIKLTLSIHRVISFVGRKWVSSFPVLERTIFSARNAITPYVWFELACIRCYFAIYFLKFQFLTSSITIHK